MFLLESNLVTCGILFSPSQLANMKDGARESLMSPMLWAWSDFGRRARACHVHSNPGFAMSDAQMLQRSLRFSFAFSHCFWTLVLASAPTSCLPCVFPPQYAVLVMGCLALAVRLVQWLALWSLSPSARVLSTKLDQVLYYFASFPGALLILE